MEEHLKSVEQYQRFNIHVFKVPENKKIKKDGGGNGRR